MTIMHRIALLSLLALVVLLTQASGLSASVSISGQVRSENGQPIPGATVIVLDSGKVVAGVATDNNGHFNLPLPNTNHQSLDLRVSSVGYNTRTQTIAASELQSALTVSLSETAVEVSGMRVTPQYSGPTQPAMKHDAVLARAAQSLVMTNPIAAIKGSQVSRVGSNLSSQIRVYGTSPVYYLNGLPIGTDPSHYGMFSYVPASIVDKMEFQPMGTTADQQLPSTVKFSTAELFGHPTGGELTLSTLEATGTFSLATDRFYVQGALRKSLLDRLVRQLDIRTNRATLPPTNFQDAFGSFGLKLSKTTRLMVDHYEVGDFLSYNASRIADVASVNTYQSSHENQFGIRLEDRHSRFFTHLALATRYGNRDYRAEPTNAASIGGIRVNLSEDYRTDFAQAGVDYNPGRLVVKAGLETEQDSHRDYSLEQRNWNFLPPFASTDNPFVYQKALNQTYGDRAGSARLSRTSGYLSGELPIGAATLVVGVRQDNYTPLRNGAFTGFRTRLGYALGSQTNLSFAWGTYSNAPLDNIIESYQVMVRTNLENLTPITTELRTVQFSWRGLGVGVFRKTLRNLPIVSPDFGAVATSHSAVGNDFIMVQSEGSARFQGIFMSVQENRLFGDRFGLNASYAYTVSHTYDHGIISRYDLDVPHRFQTQIDYRCSRKLNFGAEVQIRSGYPFSPLHSDWTADESKLYQWEYYRATLQEENSRRFSTNAYVNLSSSYRMGRVELLMAIVNVTNRANPVVYSSAGLIYDAGILPMIGLRVAL